MTEFEIIDSIYFSTAYVKLYKLIDLSFGLEHEGGGLITPVALAYPVHPIHNRSRNKRRNLWVGRRVSSWWLLFPSRNCVLMYMCIYYAFFIGILVVGRICTYTGSAVQYWWSCTPSQSIGLFFGNAQFLLVLNATSCLFGFTNCVFLYGNKTNTRMLVTIGIRFKECFDNRYFAFCNLSLTMIFLSLDPLSEHRI